ncbi:Hsp70 family protein [Nocardia asteroides]
MNSVTASVTAERPRPAVRSRRTAVTFDSAGGLRVGGIPQFSMAVTDFADLHHDPEPVIVGGRLWSPANLVAAVVGQLRSVEPGASEAGVVVTYPAVYSGKQVALLRQALDLSGAGDVLLVPEPVAAAEWLEHEQGPLDTGFVLVYDLGGTSLDVSIVRVGPDWDDHPMIGKPRRSYDFGGRPLGSMIARYAPDLPAERVGLSMTSIVDIDGLRVAHVQDSLQLVRDCVREAGIRLSDIGRVLLVGGASRPAEVAGTLAELGRPVVISADPGQTIAAGAALMAARTTALAATDGRSGAPRVAVFSSAAVVSAVAMSAVTVFGGPAVPELSPMLERLPDLGVPGDSLLVDVGSERLADAWSRVTAPTAWNASRALPSMLSQPSSAYTRFITPAPRSAGYGPSTAESQLGTHRAPRNCGIAGALRYRGYGDPAYFVNPLPFAPVPNPAAGHVAQPSVPGHPTSAGLPLPGQGSGAGQPPVSGHIAVPGAGTPATPPPGSTSPAPQNGSTSPALQNGSASIAPDSASGGTTPGNPAGSPSPGASGAQDSGTGAHGDASGTSSSDTSSSGGPSAGNPSSGNSDRAGSGATTSGGDSAGATASTGGSADDSSNDGSSGPSSPGQSFRSDHGRDSSTQSSSSGESAGNPSGNGAPRAGSAGGSPTGGSSSAGGNPSSGRPGGASSVGGRSGGSAPGASSSGGSSNRSGSAGSSGGSSGGAGGAGGGARGGR